MAQYAIFRARKLFRGRGKNAFAVCVRHLDRHKQSADISHPEYSEYNDTELYYNGKAINQIDQAIARHKEITGKNLRADASVAVEMIFTYSKDAPIDDDLFDERVRQFVAKNFPSMQLLRIDYHADETTSHWHIVGIPTTPDGRITVAFFAQKIKNKAPKKAPHEQGSTTTDPKGDGRRKTERL